MVITATGQFEAGALSSADTVLTAQSVGELRTVGFEPLNTQGVIALSNKFAEKAKAAGIPVQQIGNIKFVSGVDTSLGAFPIKPSPMRNGGGNGSLLGQNGILPFLIIGGALLLSR